MTARYLVIEADGETIAKTVVAPDETTALLQLAGGQTLLALDPETDVGAFIDDSKLAVDLTGESPAFVEIATGVAPANTALTDIAVQEVAI